MLFLVNANADRVLDMTSFSDRMGSRICPQKLQSPFEARNWYTMVCYVVNSYKSLESDLHAAPYYRTRLAHECFLNVFLHCTYVPHANSSWSTICTVLLQLLLMPLVRTSQA